MYSRRDSSGTNVGCKWDASEYDLVLFASAGSSRLLGHEGNRKPRICFSVHWTSRWNRQARNRFGEEYQRMFLQGDGHVLLLAASIRSLEHLVHCLSIDVDMITVPSSILSQWAIANFPVVG